MNRSIRTLILTLILTVAPTLMNLINEAQAAQYEVFLAQPANQTATASEYQGILEKSILIDTSSRTLRLPMAQSCNTKGICTEAMRWVQYQLFSASFKNGSLSHLIANQGESQIEITMGVNYSTLVVIRTFGNKSEAHFMGGPVEATRY
jgi:hypothetical protein